MRARDGIWEGLKERGGRERDVVIIISESKRNTIFKRKNIGGLNVFLKARSKNRGSF